MSEARQCHGSWNRRRDRTGRTPASQRRRAGTVRCGSGQESPSSMARSCRRVSSSASWRRKLRSRAQKVDSEHRDQQCSESERRRSHGEQEFGLRRQQPFRSTSRTSPLISALAGSAMVMNHRHMAPPHLMRGLEGVAMWSFRPPTPNSLPGGGPRRRALPPTRANPRVVHERHPCGARHEPRTPHRRWDGKSWQRAFWQPGLRARL
jgi:hypothetical protein